MTMLDDRLRALGDTLDLTADEDLVDEVLARLDEPTSTGARPLLRVAAALVLVLALTTAAVPSSRRAVADWFGFDGVRIERRPGPTAGTGPSPLDRDTTDATTGIDDLSTADDPDAGPTATDAPPAIGSVVEVDGTEILVSEFVGTLDNPAIGKTIGDGTDVQPVEIGGEFGLWIDGEPHDVSFMDERGDIVFEGIAGNTLLWQDGSVIRRLEGFPDVTTAIAYAEQLGP